MSVLRVRLRRLGFGLATILGVARRGYFIPCRHAGAGMDTQAPYGPAQAALDAVRGDFGAVLRDMARFMPELHEIGRGGEARWDQDWFPRLDAAVAYMMVRTARPAHVVEIGSGHSTRFLARAVADAGLATSIVAIDPAPRADVARLSQVRCVRQTLQATLAAGGGTPFDDLAPGDILSIDSSHVLMPGSDVDAVLNRILPTLPSGVLVHIHDIFLPDGYPSGWAWRGYNEQQGVLPLLTGGGWSVLFASRYVVLQMADVLAASVVAGLPLVDGAYESSLWIKKR